MNILLHGVKRKQCGFVLLVVLSALALLALYALYTLQTTLIAARITRLQWQREVLMFDGQAILQVIESGLKEHMPGCVIKPISEDTLLAYPESFWHSAAACHGQRANNRYDYVIEYWEKPSELRYYKISVYIRASTNAKMLWQRLLVKPTSLPWQRRANRELTFKE